MRPKLRPKMRANLIAKTAEGYALKTVHIEFYVIFAKNWRLIPFSESEKKKPGAERVRLEMYQRGAAAT